MLELLVSCLVTAAFSGWFGFRLGRLTAGRVQKSQVEQSTILANDAVAVLAAPEPAPPSKPVAVEGGALVPEREPDRPTALFQVRVRKGEVVKIVAEGSEAAMKSQWRSHVIAGPGRIVELYDVRLGIVRGSR